MPYNYDSETQRVDGHATELKSRLSELKVAMQAGKATAAEMLAKGRGTGNEWDYVNGGAGAATEALAITRQLKAIQEDEDLVARLGRLGAPSSEDEMDREQDQFNREQVKAGLTEAIRRKGSYGFNAPLRKAAITRPDLPSGGTAVAEEPLGAAAVALRDMFTQQTAAAGTVRYYRLGAGSGADVVPEGGLKPELVAGIEPVDAALDKIAVRFTYTDEMVEDANFLVEYINREATRAVLLRENQLIISTFDSDTEALEASGPKAEAIDLIATAIGAAEGTNGLAPTRVVANPIDVADLRTTKSSGSGEYALDPLSGATTAIHGVPTTSTPAVAPGTMYLTTPGLGAFYTRGSLRIESGYTGDDWMHNRVTTRVEERVLPVVLRPTLLTRLTLEPAA